MSRHLTNLFLVDLGNALFPIRNVRRNIVGMNGNASSPFTLTKFGLAENVANGHVSSIVSTRREFPIQLEWNID